MQGTQRYVTSFVLLAGVVVWQTLLRLFHNLMLVMNWYDFPTPLLGPRIPISSVVALVLSMGGIYYVLNNRAAIQYLNDVVTELWKVAWPDRKETQDSTVTVIVTTLVISMILGVFDLVWLNLTGFIYTPQQ